MKTCAQCTTVFEVNDADRIFLDRMSPVFSGQKYAIPEPTLCPDCRQARRLSWRNERHLYKRACALCRKPVIAIYSEDKPFQVYCRACWWGDAWDATAFGRTFDFTRSFFEQYAELLAVVPKSAVLSFEVENCDYTNYQNDSKNCYLTFGSGFMEDCQYTDWVYHAKNSFDDIFCHHSERDYMNVDCSDSFHSRFCQDSKNISDCAYCFDCRGCRNCFGCVGLRNKEYHLFNQPLGKEEYLRLTEKLKDPALKGKILEEVRKLKLAHPHVAARLTNSEACDGDGVDDCKNCRQCFNLKESQDCRFVCDALNMKDVMDANRVGGSEVGYELACGGYYHHVSFSAVCAYFSDGLYSYECMNSKNSFGCVGLNHQEYCVLNKKYTKEAYEALVPKIIEHMRSTGEWGEFFPAAISPFAYNETVAQEFFPLSREAVAARGWSWNEPDKKEYLPASGDVLACEITGKNFKLTPQEAQFYKEEGLPPPARCPDQRYLDLLALKNPRKLWPRACAKCGAAMQTTYAPERPEIVYCESCYLKEVY